MVKIKEIGHAVLNVRDPKVSTRWYVDVLGMEIVAEVPAIPAIFLSFGRRDHDLALFKSEPTGERCGRQLNHLAFKRIGVKATPIDLMALRS